MTITQSFINLKLFILIFAGNQNLFGKKLGFLQKKRLEFDYFCFRLMKKIAIILLIGVYALATMGFSLREFYCCGKLGSKSVTLITSENKKCSKGNNDDRCCKNKYQYFKVKDNHVSADHINLPAKHFVSLHLCEPSSHDIAFYLRKPAVPYRSNAPPLHRNIPTYLSNCVFRIWFNLLWQRNILFALAKFSWVS